MSDDEKPPAVPRPDGPPPVPGVEIFDVAEVPAAAVSAEPVPTGPVLAHPVLRALAFFMDGVGTVVVTVLAVFGGLGASYDLAFYPIVAVPFASALLSTVLTATLGVTPSKAIVGIKVVDAETGRPIGWRSILRSLVIVAPIGLTFLVGYAAYFLPNTAGDTFFAIVLLPPIAGWVALLVVLCVRPRYRGLQDLAGRSLVVRR
jgi:uncharacterized RDD family membrane protein YckC